MQSVTFLPPCKHFWHFRNWDWGAMPKASFQVLNGGAWQCALLVTRPTCVNVSAGYRHRCGTTLSNWAGKKQASRHGRAARDLQVVKPALSKNVDLCVAARHLVLQRRLMKPAVGVSFRRSTTDAIRKDLSVLGAFDQMLLIRQMMAYMSNLLLFSILFFSQTWIIVEVHQLISNTD